MIIFQNVVEVKYLQVEELQNEPFSFSLPKKFVLDKQQQGKKS
jgi:hypothetical protein